MGTVEEEMFCGLHIISSATYGGCMVSWKPCLNLSSLKWLKLILSIVIRQIPLGLWEFKAGCMNLRILVLKTEKMFDFLKRGSKLFHSTIVDGKKKALKKLCFVFRRGMLCMLQVSIKSVWQESSWKDI